MANTGEVLKEILNSKGAIYPVLVPNLKGYNQAKSFHAKHISLFTAASETFCQKNINCSISQSLSLFEDLCERARADKISVRCYISCALGCPYEGEIEPSTVAEISDQLYKMGCNEISLGDTIGIGTPNKSVELIEAVKNNVPSDHIAVHFHDTFGQALANIYATVSTCGIQIVDCSVSGLGGCPYAPGASGNVATEDVVYMLEGLGINTGVNLDALCQVGEWISKKLDRDTRSNVAQARHHG